MGHIVVILNPAAGREAGRGKRPELEQLLTEAAASHPDRPTWEIIETTAPKTDAALAQKAAANGAQIVAAAGGDGTLSGVANGLYGSEARLGILPLGTGNEFSRHLGIGLDLPKAVHTLLHGTPLTFDLGQAKGVYFLNIAGCGFDAVVAERVNQGYRNLRGTAAYLAATVSSLLRFRAVEMTLTLDGNTRQVKAMMCSVANATSYGGGMLITPDAKIDDGLFDICLLHETGKIEFLQTFPKVFKGEHTSHPKVEILRAKHVAVECNPPMPVFIDGELQGHTPVEFSIVPHAMTIMAPSPAS